MQQGISPEGQKQVQIRPSGRPCPHSDPAVSLRLDLKWEVLAQKLPRQKKICFFVPSEKWPF